LHCNLDFVHQIKLTITCVTPKIIINKRLWWDFIMNGCKKYANEQKIEADNQVETEGSCEEILWSERRGKSIKTFASGGTTPPSQRIAQ
jgi:hypothetical protein